MELKIEYVQIDSVSPYEGNVKKHPKKQIDQIAKSIQEFGFNDPCAICDGILVEGHGRLLAAQQLGMDMIPVIRLDGLTDEQRRAYTLIHNQLNTSTGYDLKQLAIELENITSIDMPSFDLDLPEIRLQLSNSTDNEDFSIDDISEIEGYDAKNDGREYFQKTFAFPLEKKQQITNYLKKHYDEVINRIIHDAETKY